MNEMMRLLQRSLRPFGYDIRKRKTLNLLPFKGVGPTPSLKHIRDVFDNDQAAGKKETANLDKLTIIYRTCLTERRNLKSTNHVAGATLSESIGRCFRSVIKSTNAALEKNGMKNITFLILDDHSDPLYATLLKEMASHLKCPWVFKTTEGTGQGASLHEQFSLAQKEDGLFYFCEDDYLHEITAIDEMWEFYRQIYASTRAHLVLHPQEHECLYNSSFYPSYIFLSPTRHWRSVSDATHIFLTHAHVVRDYWHYFENTKYVGNRKKRQLGSEKQTTNRLFDHLPGFVPLPALAGHMQSEHVLPPFFKWEQLWQDNATI